MPSLGVYELPQKKKRSKLRLLSETSRPEMATEEYQA